MLGDLRAEHLVAARRQGRDVPEQLRRTVHRLEQLHHQQARPGRLSGDEVERLRRVGVRQRRRE